MNAAQEAAREVATEHQPDATPLRERGWKVPILAAVLFLLLPATPILRIVVPLEQSVVLLAPLFAALALAGWRAGGRLPLAALWTAFAVWVLWQPGSVGTTFGMLSRGWAAMLAACFGAVLLAPVGERFLTKALLALGGALVLGAVMVLLAPGGATGAFEIYAGEIGRRAAISVRQWQEMTSTVEWQAFVQNNPDAGALALEVDRQLAELPVVGQQLFLAFLALQSLAAMALGWAVYHRVGAVRLGPPLARLRDLRFEDSLIWGVVAGLVIVVLPVTGAVRALGLDLLVFFGALYALRGLGVMIWFLAPGRWMMVFLTIFTLLFWHVVGIMAALIGLGDTWMDWRRRTRPKSQRSE
ncbi:MAG: YybS family protein [Gemmatimonadales bacterium]|nr:hypothetical protein [Gemmatimonadota bacterium]MCL4213753.1 YybS family protein [Gemmatimonadales bacterium]